MINTVANSAREAQDQTARVPGATSRLQALPRPSFYDQRAARRPRELRRRYHELLKTYYRSIVPPGLRVLELGCGLGDLLAAVEPAPGIGVDASPVIIKLARQRHPNLHLCVAEAESFCSDEPFDYILLSDLVNEVYDVQALLAHLHDLSHPRTRLVINFYNHLWRPILTAAEWLGAKAPTPPQNWLSTQDMTNLLYLSGWEVIKTEPRILWPLRTPLLANLCNRWLAPLLRHLCLTTIQVARPFPIGSRHWACGNDYSCSVIIPARNEAGNIEELVSRIPNLGSGTEIIFIEGGSTDNTWKEIQRVAKENPHRNIKTLRQAPLGSQSKIGNQNSKILGKASAVRQGFAAAAGDLLFILDADLSVPPEELSKFYEVAARGKAEFINGVRSVYPMQDGAMRFCNMVGNKFFSLIFGSLLGHPIKDTLCGTKVLFRNDYQAIARGRAYFGDFDPFGDFDLLLGAAKLNLRTVDLPIHYQARTYGETNISRWRHGWLLLRTALIAASSLKFLPMAKRPGLGGTHGEGRVPKYDRIGPDRPSTEIRQTFYASISTDTALKGL
jgi:glycosyltransferase involved in cell wall biosynthesis/SAM-dependent methyltransferase